MSSGAISRWLTGLSPTVWPRGTFGEHFQGFERGNDFPVGLGVTMRFTVSVQLPFTLLLLLLCMAFASNIFLGSLCTFRVTYPLTQITQVFLHELPASVLSSFHS